MGADNLVRARSYVAAVGRLVHRVRRLLGLETLPVIKHSLKAAIGACAGI